MSSPNTPRILLDTMVWNYVIDGTPQVPSAEELASAAARGRVEIVGTVGQITEFVGMAPQHPGKFLATIDLYKQLVGRRLIRPLDELNQLELRHGGRLPERLRYAPGEVRSRVFSATADPARVREVSDANHHRTARLRASAVDNRTSFRARLDDAGLKLSPNKQELCTDRSITEWTTELAHAGTHGSDGRLPEAETADLRRLPTLWLLTAYNLALIHSTVACNQRILESDEQDGAFCAAGAYFDILITNDRRYRERLSIIPDLPFHALPIDDLAGLLGGQTVKSV